uniref:Uncharacterized protein n=1 Tax=Rhizophora mucronata TaxID=61149 RepID=A0A2P2NBQ2_RHIMU
MNYFMGCKQQSTNNSFGLPVKVLRLQTYKLSFHIEILKSSL